VTTDLNALLTGLYVRIDEYLGAAARAGAAAEAELVTLAVAQPLAGTNNDR
jgi:hypothetical protein